MLKYIPARSPILVLLIATFSIGYTVAQNRVVVVPLIGDEGMPSGAIVAFNSQTCPVGWSPASATRGRTIVGLNNGGTLAGAPSPPNALTDLEVRTHGHQWALFFGENKNWNTFNDIGNTRSLIDWENGIGNEGSGFYPISKQDPANTFDTFYTNRQAAMMPYVQYLYCLKT